MGSHRDKDEDEPRAPVLSVSLGDDAIFHVGGDKRGDPKVRVTLRSGDVCLHRGVSVRLCDTRGGDRANDGNLAVSSRLGRLGQPAAVL